VTTTRTTGDKRRRQVRPRVCASRTGRSDATRLLRGECIEVMAGLAESSVDAVVCDPPYGIGWQNARWDSGAIKEAATRRAGRRLSANEAFEVWCGLWGKECARVLRPGGHLLAFGSPRTYHRLAAGLEDAGLEIRDTLLWLHSKGMTRSRHYPGGLRTTLKPAVEPIVLARRPLEGTTEDNLARFGTGALNGEACRVHGRDPANVVASHDPDCGGEICAPGCAVALLDAAAAGGEEGVGPQIPPSRFLYCPKPSRAERDAGCEELPERPFNLAPDTGPAAPARNTHPTLKPIGLMRWLIRLACPVGGLVLDPFMGSGTTGVGAVLEHRRFCGIELEGDYIEIAAARIEHWRGRACPASGEGPARRPFGSRRRR
jgi:DNA modification methylase